jgi:KilA-N domain
VQVDRYGGTYAHKDIAVEFCSWLSPEFKLLLIKEFQRLKEQEAQRLNEEWDLKRMLTKINYRIHTEAIRDSLIPNLNITKDKEMFVYATEAEILNAALFGITSKEWKQKNPNLTLQGKNIRDYADLHELTVLSNLESYNSILISQNVLKEQRLIELHKIAKSQLKTLQSMSNYSLDKLKSPNIKRIGKTDNDVS